MKEVRFWFIVAGCIIVTWLFIGVAVELYKNLLITLIILAIVVTVAATVGAWVGWHYLRTWRLEHYDKWHTIQSNIEERGLRIKELNQQLYRGDIDNMDASRQQQLQNGLLLIDPNKAILDPYSREMVYHPHRAVKVKDDGPEVVDAPLVLPVAPSWGQVADKITGPDRILLGWNDGPVYGSVKNLLSIAIIGKPERGKTTCLMFFIAELLTVGAGVTILDPHGTLGELRYGLDYISKRDFTSSAKDPIGRIERMLDIRLDQHESGQRTFSPHMILIDEFLSIADAKHKDDSDKDVSKYLKDVVQRIILEGRKVGLYLMLSGHGFPASLFGSSTARNNLSSRIIFYTHPAQAKMVGLEDEYIKSLLPHLKGLEKKGIAILDCDNRDEPEIVAIPYTTENDIAAIIKQQGRVVDSLPLPHHRAISAPVATSPHTAPTPIRPAMTHDQRKRQSDLAKIPEADRHFILREYRSGTSRRDILPKMRKGKGYFWAVKAVCDEEDEQQTRAS